MLRFLALPAEPMEVIAHDQRDRAPARGIQAPDQDPVRPAHCRNGLHVVLGLAGLRPITLRRVDGWDTLHVEPDQEPLDLTA